jgi:hypothetical protein
MFKKCYSAAGSKVPNKTYLQRCREQGAQKNLPTALQGARCPTKLTYSAVGSKVAKKKHVWARLGTFWLDFNAVLLNGFLENMWSFQGIPPKEKNKINGTTLLQFERSEEIRLRK